jgi:hypothetical protein
VGRLVQNVKFHDKRIITDIQRISRIKAPASLLLSSKTTVWPIKVCTYSAPAGKEKVDS